MTEDKFEGTLFTVEYDRNGTVLPGNESPSVSGFADKEVFRDYLSHVSDRVFKSDFYGDNSRNQLILKIAAGRLLDDAGFCQVPLAYATPLGNKFFPQENGRGWNYSGIGGIPIDLLEPAITYRDSSLGTWDEQHKEPQTLDVLIGHDLRSLVGGEVKKGYSLVRIPFSKKEHREARNKADQLTSLYARELISHQGFLRRTITESIRLYFHPFKKDNQDALEQFIHDCNCYYGKDALFKAIYDEEPKVITFPNQGEGI